MDWKRITILLFLPAVLFQSCGGSELAPEERDVTLDRPLLEWRPALRADIPGFYVSREIEGEAAASVLSMEYLFQEDGSYTGAALVLDENGRPSFQTLSGTWRLEESSSFSTIPNRPKPRLRATICAWRLPPGR